MTDFGRPMLSEWHLDPSVTYLNHGTVGATPKRVLQRQWDLMVEIERHPADFILRRLADPHAIGGEGDPPLMRQTAAAVANYVGADEGGMVLVDNITTAANAVIGSIDLGPGDVVAVTSHGYGGVTNAVQRAADAAGATVQVIELPVVGAGTEEFVEAFRAQLDPATRLAIVDHISSSSALVMPIESIVQICQEAGVPIFVDGAHAPGQLPLTVGDLGADWYAANLHKWAWTPRSSGFLWASPQRRDATYPVVTSWGFGNGLAAEFDVPGTRDPSAHLAFAEALAMRSDFGEAAILDHNHGLVWEAAQRLADAWSVEFTTPEDMVGSMAVVQLPARLDTSAESGQRVRAILNDDQKIEVPVFSPHVETARCATESGLAVRVSTQIYNDLDDIERLAEAVLALASPN